MFARSKRRGRAPARPDRDWTATVRWSGRFGKRATLGPDLRCHRLKGGFENQNDLRLFFGRGGPPTQVEKRVYLLFCLQLRKVAFFLLCAAPFSAPCFLPCFGRIEVVVFQRSILIVRYRYRKKVGFCCVKIEKK